MKSFNRRAGLRRNPRGARRERGTAIIIAVMVMALLAIFVAATISRSTNETLMMSNDQANTEAYFAAQASLEHMSRNFTEVFDLRPFVTTGDIARINADLPPGFDDFDFVQSIEEETPGVSEVTTVDVGSPFAGLVATRQGWRVNATAVGPTNAEVRLTRTLNNYLIPIFQFGIFYDDPMEHHPGPAFNFGGRVHTNGDIYLMAGNTSTYFKDRVTAAGEVVTDFARNGFPYTHWGQRVKVNDGTAYQIVGQGSVIGGADTPERKAARGGDDPDLMDGTRNAGWPAYSARFRGNLIARSPFLRLPLQLDGGIPADIIRRGLPGDPLQVRTARYYNKNCVRVSLSNSQAELPASTGGVQLNATAQPNAVNQVPGGATSGYWPTPRTGGPARATRVNGYRLTPVANRQVWIKIENVVVDEATGLPVATDITESILSLGMTQSVRIGGVDFGDQDAIVKIQRFAMAGPPPRVSDANYTSNSNVTADYWFQADATNPRSAQNRNTYTYLVGATTPQSLSVVASPNLYVNGGGEQNFEYPLAAAGPNITTYNPRAGAKPNTTTTAPTKLVPFPIMMFDTREGLFNDDVSNGLWQTLYRTPATSQKVPVNGVMGMIDFDVANFRRLVNGNFDGTMPGGLTGAQISNNGEGWIVYFSDRRNDIDNDGQYDNENVYVGDSSSTLTAADAAYTTGFEPGEDVNFNGTLDVSYDNAGVGTGESATFATGREADIMAFMDTPWNRRAQRLINGALLPGTEFDGFTFSSENGVYIQGNYNATHVTAIGSPTPYTDYRNSLGAMVPASVVSDGITILGNEWNDGKSFRWALQFGDAGTAADGRRSRSNLTIRTALLMGDTRSWLVDPDGNGTPNTYPNQGGGDESLAGGVHNFKRFREDWGHTVSYCGSLINLFNSVNQTGPFKCCTKVYSPPVRDWVFDTNFLDPRRLPPGTPYFQYINLTGFRRSYVQGT